MISESAAERVSEWVTEATAAGATLLAGGGREGLLGSAAGDFLDIAP